MSSIQNASQLFDPLGVKSPSIPRLKGTLWGKLVLARGFYRGVEVVAKWLARVGVSADAITYASLVMALISGVAVGIGHPGLAAICLLLSGSLDLLDGAVARTTGSASRWGALLDSTLDRLGDAAPMAGVIFYYSHLPWAAAAPLLTIVAGFTISYVRARAEGLGLRLPSLFMRRAERVLLVAGSLALGTVGFEVAVSAPLMLAGVALTGILSVIGAVTILAAARNALREDAS